MKGIQFAILRCGVGVPDLKAVDEGAWYYCVLIKHPTAGYLMYDVGVGPADDSFRRPEAHIKQCPLGITRDEYLDKNLEKLGLTVNDINGIIISHCHWDHFGGLTFFKGTEAIKNVYVYEEDFKQGLMQSHRTAKGYVEPCDFYYRWNFDVEGAEFKILPGDCEPFPGIELKVLKGHTKAGVMCMVLHAEDGTYIFTSDTIPRRENYEDPDGNVHFTTIDVDAFKQSVEIVKELEKKYHATMFFPHDDGTTGEYKPFFRGNAKES